MQKKQSGKSEKEDRDREDISIRDIPGISVMICSNHQITEAECESVLQWMSPDRLQIKPLAVQQRVLAWTAQSEDLHTGSILTCGPDSYHVLFDRAELGV